MSRLTPLGLLAKWVVAPAAVAALGYFVVGPRIGDGVLKNIKVPDPVRALLQKPGGKLATTKPEASSTTGPSIDISVSTVRQVSLEPATIEEPPRPRRKRKKRPVQEPKVVQPAPIEDIPEPPAGNSDGDSDGDTQNTDNPPTTSDTEESLGVGSGEGGTIRF